jgi:hypothetical protein
MTKNIGFTLLMSLFFFFSYAQETEEKTPGQWELGANITNLINQIFDSNGGVSNQSPYVLVANYNYNEKKSLRLGIGMNLRASTNASGLENVGQLEVVRDIRSNLRVGMEFRKKVAKKWRLHYGLDFVGAVNSFKTKQGDFGVTQTNNDFFSAGLGPVIGFAFTPNDNIAIWTEANWYFTYNSSKTKFRFDNFPQNSIETTENSVTGDITVPLSLFISFKL